MTEQLTQSQRDDYIDQSRRIALDTLQIPEVQHRLGGYANELFALTHSIVSVPINDGKVTDEDIDPRSIPATVIRAGERVDRLVSSRPFDAFQLETMERLYGEEEALSLVAAYKKGAQGKSLALFNFDRQSAHMHTMDVRLGKKRIKGRPMNTFNYDRSRRPYVDPPIWYHEAYHDKQARELNVWDLSEIDLDSQELSWELEAYRIAAMTILGIQDAGLQAELLSSISAESMDRTLEIEEIRQYANRYETDPHAASHRVANDLVKNGHGITKFLTEKIESGR